MDKHVLEVILEQTSTVARESFHSQDLNGLKLPGAYLIQCDLKESQINKAQIECTGFELCGFMQAELIGSLIRDVTFGRCDMRDANFSGASLKGVTMTMCDLRSASFAGADLSSATFIGCKLGSCVFEGAKINWISHELLAELLKRSALRKSEIIDRELEFAALVNAGDPYGWCWAHYLGIINAEPELKSWVCQVFSMYDWENGPAELIELMREEGY